VNGEHRLLVVALGGNAIQQPDGEDTVEADFARTTATAEHLAGLVRSGWRLVVTHGNGPQVGNHLLRAELAHVHGDLPLLPLDVCVADTQGGMGYMIQQCLTNALHDAGLPAVVTTLVTQVLVDRDDPGFAAPAKPVGEMIPDERAGAMEAQGWTLARDQRRGGWRRVVASPDPREIVEAAAIAAMVADGVVVIACGGGGIPVVQDENGDVQGVAAVVDKDLASSLLARDLKADGLMILTDVDRVRLDFGTDEERSLDEMSVADALRWLDEGQFPAGSMGPKVRAVTAYVEATDGLGVIAAIEDCEPAAAGSAGTRIVS